MKKAYSGMVVWFTTLLILAFSTAAMAQRYYDHGWGMMHPWFGGIIMWIIIFLLILFLIYLFVRSTRQPSTPYGGGETPLDIAKKRYARGEISKAEFDEMKKDLTG